MNMSIKKFARVENTDPDLLADGIVAFQLVEFTYNWFGKEMTDELDTKIMEDGSQYVIDGNGFIPAGTKVNYLYILQNPIFINK